MRNPRLKFAIFLFSIIAFSAEAQEPEGDPKLPKEIREAYDAFDAQEYFYAIELLKDAYEEAEGRDQKAEVLFKTAEAYRMMNDYKEAETFYNKAIKVGYKDPKATLLMGDMLKAQGEYEDAIEAYQDYKKENPTDSQGDIAIESTRKAIERKNKPSQYQVDNMKDINSRALDFAVMFGGDRKGGNIIYFISSRDESVGSDDDGWTGQSFMDIYKTEAERKGRGRRRSNNDGAEGKEVSYADLKWSTPVLLDEEELLNSEFHEGTATFDSRKKELYFTRCIVEDNQKLGCGIYTSEMVGQSWSEPLKLIIGGDTTANIGDPNLSIDDKYLYFVSDDFNSNGRHDIFVTTFDRRSKNWKTPTNLGPKVNTSGSERFPVVHGDGYLYFASDGHPGMGGLDVYKVKLGEDGMPEGDIIHMEAPINSSKDDFHLIWEPGAKTQKGFVSSNREGSSDDSDDIWSVYRTPLVFNLEGVVLSAKTKQPIPEAEITLDGSDGSSVAVTADQDGYYIFDDTKVAENVNYKLNFSKKKFIASTGDVTTIGFEIDAFEYVPSAGYYIKRLRLNKELVPIEDPIVLPNVFFDLGKAFLRPEAKSALDSVLVILSNNPTFVIELRSHTDYRDSDDRNDRLSKRRADSCVAYLITKGVDAARLVAVGRGESEPFVIPVGYIGYGKESFAVADVLTERFIKTQSPEVQEIGNQINRRTDFKVLRDDYIPSEGLVIEEGVDPKDIIQDKRDGSSVVKPGEIYTLTKRESYAAISRKYKMNMRDFKSLNGGMRGLRPFVGQQIKVEKDGNYEAWDATHFLVVKKGSDLGDVAKAVDVDEDVLEELNPFLEDVAIQPGLWIQFKK